MDAAVEHPILGDRFAAEADARIDYDFAALKLPSGGANPESTVLHLVRLEPFGAFRVLTLPHPVRVRRVLR